MLLLATHAATAAARAAVAAANNQRMPILCVSITTSLCSSTPQCAVDVDVAVQQPLVPRVGRVLQRAHAAPSGHQAGNRCVESMSGGPAAAAAYDCVGFVMQHNRQGMRSGGALDCTALLCLSAAAKQHQACWAPFLATCWLRPHRAS